MTSIIIVCHNSSDVIKECLRSVAKHEDSSQVEIILVDNASRDEHKEIIRSLEAEYNNVKSLLLEEDKGFSYANNRGYELSSGENIIIMNPDIIFTESVISGLEKDLEEYGAVCPLLIGTDGRFQRNYFQRYPSVMQFVLFTSILAKIFNKSSKLMNKYLENQDVDVNSAKVEQVEQIPGAFFMIKREMFERVRKMDEGYKLFFEDVDISYQVNKVRKLGVDTRYRVTHLGGTSFQTDENWWLYGRYVNSMLYFFKKNYSGARYLLLRTATIINSYFIILLEKIKKPFGKAETYRYKKHKNFLNELKGK